MKKSIHEIAVAAYVAIICLPALPSTAVAAECKGTDTEIVVCIANKKVKINKAEARKIFGSKWKIKYDSIAAKCAVELDGPKSTVADMNGAVRLDWAECVWSRLLSKR